MRTLLRLKMADCLQYSNCFIVYLLCILLPGNVTSEVDAVYKFLSWKLDEVLAETKHLKLKVDNIDNRVKLVEDKLQGLPITTVTANPVDLTLRDERQESENEHKERLKTEVIALQKMVSAEKTLLRKSMENMNEAFVGLKSELQAQMSVFNASLNQEEKRIGTEFDNLKFKVQLEISEYNKSLSDNSFAIKASLENNLKNVFGIVNNNSMVLMKGIAELTSVWNLTTHNSSQILQTMNRTMVSKTEDIETRMNSKLISLSNRINVLERSRGDVSFIAYLDHEVNNMLGKVVIFNKVITNDGYGYSPYTGVFTCPRAGMYLFSFMVSQRGNSGEVDVKLMKNGQTIVAGVVETYQDGLDLQGGNTAPLRLNIVDTVYLVVMHGHHVMGWPEYRITSFSGVFLYD